MPDLATRSTPALALFGGSFDPVHEAHLRVAGAALSQLPLDQVVFIPAAQSPLKVEHTVASAEDRVAMLRLATADEPRFAVDTCELERGGTSFTVDTVARYRRRHPKAELYWIIGADQVMQLGDWVQIETIAREVSFIVLERPGYRLEAPDIPGLRLVEVELPPMEHSSSGVRSRLASGQSVSDWLPPSVEAFISSHGLYTQ